MESRRSRLSWLFALAASQTLLRSIGLRCKTKLTCIAPGIDLQTRWQIYSAWSDGRPNDAAIAHQPVCSDREGNGDISLLFGTDRFHRVIVESVLLVEIYSSRISAANTAPPPRPATKAGTATADHRGLLSEKPI